MVKNGLLSQIELLGGALSLDYINTVHDRKSDPIVDYLHSEADLLAWAKRAGMVSKEDKLTPLTNSDFKQAIEIRELLYRIFYSIVQAGNVDNYDLQAFNAHTIAYLPGLKLIQTGKLQFEEKWQLSDTMSTIIATILKDAKELLLSSRINRIKECPKCGWLFADATKNGKRKWCSMKNCGSASKALEWYHRKKGTNI